MIPRKLDIGIARLTYAANGGSQAEHPDCSDWLVKTALAARTDEWLKDRIGRVMPKRFSDTPVTMVRNSIVEWAKDKKLDVLIMLDSDQAPDLYLGHEHQAKPFFDSSFRFLYEHYEKGPVTVFSPYCGPPGHPTTGGHENVYVFKWENFHTGHIGNFKLEQYTRPEAAIMHGIQEAAAGPTGLCMIDMRCFDCLLPPYFYYEYEKEGPKCPMCGICKPGVQAEKGSTEDVTFFRDLSLNGCQKLGYNPVFCNWDAWAGHWKGWCVGKPSLLTASDVSYKFREACQITGGEVPRTIQVKCNDEDLKNAPMARQPTQWEQNGQKNRVAQWVSKPQVVEPKPIVLDFNQPGEHHFLPFANMPEVERLYLRTLVKKEAERCYSTGRSIRIVELGSWAGRSAELMAEACDGRCPFEIHCVDHFKGVVDWHIKTAEQFDVEAEFRKNTERFGRSIVLHRNDTHSAAVAWAQREDTAIDLLFIDADHDYEPCLRDITDWAPFVVPGGIIIGHDYSAQFPGVKRAVHEYFGYNVAVKDSFWIVVKDDAGKPMLVEPIASEKPETVGTNGKVQEGD